VRRSLKSLVAVLFLAALLLVAIFQIVSSTQAEAYAIVQADGPRVAIAVFGAENGCRIAVLWRNEDGDETEASNFSSDDEARASGFQSLFIRLANLLYSRRSEDKFVANVSIADCLLSNKAGAKLVLKPGEPVLIFTVIRNSAQGQSGDRLFLLRER
jgi:hypothetical protein